jgi:hypothetical protein
MKKPSGYIFYRGISRLTGAPIVGVAITKSTNAKTGNMVQTYILVDNGISPVNNAKTLADEAICGICPHRRGLGGSCYVNLGQGPRAVADGVVRGIYPDATVDSAAHAQMIEAITGRMVRFGTYGDPAAIGVEYWDQFKSVAKGTTGYTHQWSNGRADDHMHLVMASADNEQARIAAKAQGYRTFRVRLANEPVLKGEFICPASTEAGKVKTCADCGACAGGVNTKKADPVIVVHGSLASRFAASQMVAA